MKVIANYGFTLIELLMVVSIIGLLAVGAIPNLLRARMSAMEAGAIGSMKTLAAVQTDYHNNTSPHTFATNLQQLGTGNQAGGVAFIDDNLASGFRMGYRYSLEAGSPMVSPDSSIPSFQSWSATAWPIVYGSTGVRSFYIDQSAVIRGADLRGTSGTDTLPAIY